jgi:hypothetical protein
MYWLPSTMAFVAVARGTARRAGRHRLHRTAGGIAVIHRRVDLLRRSGRECHPKQTKNEPRMLRMIRQAGAADAALDADQTAISIARPVGDVGK